MQNWTLKSRASYPCRKLLWPLAQSFKQLSSYLRQFREHTNEIKRPQNFISNKSQQRKTHSRDGLQLPGWADAPCINMSLLFSSQDTANVKDKTRTLPMKRCWTSWTTRDKRNTRRRKFITRRKPRALLPLPLNRPPGQQGSSRLCTPFPMLLGTAGAQRAAPHQWATSTQEFGSLAAAGYKSLNRWSSHFGHLSLGCPAGSPPARQCGAPRAKSAERRQSHHFSSSTRHFNELICDFKLLLLVSLCPDTVEGCQESPLQTCSAGQASSESAAAGVQP